MAESDPALENRLRGMFLGLALGSAVGLKAKHDERGLLEFPYREGVGGYTPCDWGVSGDQVCLVLETLLHSQHNFRTQSWGREDLLDLAQRLQLWKEKGFPELGDQRGLGLSGLTRFVVEAEGFPAHPRKVARELWLKNGRKFASNASLSRGVALSLLFLFGNFEEGEVSEDYWLGLKEFTQLTHEDARCVVSVWVLVELLRLLLLRPLGWQESGAGEVFLTVSRLVEERVGELEESLPYLDLLNLSQKEFYSEDGRTWEFQKEFQPLFKPHTLQALELGEEGAGSYTLKALSLVVWVFNLAARHTSTRGRREKGGLDFWLVLEGVCGEGGDSEVNSALAGALLGAYLGEKNLPQELLEALPHRAWLSQKLDLLMEKLYL